MNANNPSREHHYVPRFLLRPWTQDGNLNGYYWDPFLFQVKVRSKGVAYFCKKIDLLTLSGRGAKADLIETEFFGRIDDLGAKSAAKLRDCDPDELTLEERTDFARLLLSLDARRPSSVTKLSREYPVALAKALNEDPEIEKAFSDAKVSEEPLVYWERNLGFSREDQALLTLQRLVDNPIVGERLLNANWIVVRLKQDHGTLLISDRPLVRIHAFDHENALWALPLGPNLLFIASNSMHTISNIESLGRREVRKLMNISSINQIDKFIFASDDTNRPLIEKSLRPPVAASS